MLSALRRAIAVVLAGLVTALTLGRVEVSWTGRRGGHAADGPGDAAVTSVLDRERDDHPPRSRSP